MGKRRRTPRIHIAPDELNLVPLLDMISLLIQVLLVNIHFGALAQISSQQAVPAEGGEPTSDLELDVGVDDKGYQIAWSQGGERQKKLLPCRSAECVAATDYDVSGLRAMLAGLKRDHPGETSAVISPFGPIPFEVVAATMDAVRTDPSKQPMFPDLVVADGR